MPRMSVFVRTGFWIGFGAVTAAFATGGIDQARAQDLRLGAFLQVGISASAENITFEFNSATYAIKKITLQGTSLSNSDLATLLDPKAALSLSERFAKLNASEIAIPELTITTKSAPIQKLTYENIKLSDVKQGRATSADIDGAQFTFTDPKAGSMEGTYGHIHAQNVDLALGAHLMTEARKDDSEPLKTLYESFSVDGLKMKGTGKEGLSLDGRQFYGPQRQGPGFRHASVGHAGRGERPGSRRGFGQGYLHVIRYGGNERERYRRAGRKRRQTFFGLSCENVIREFRQCENRRHKIRELRRDRSRIERQNRRRRFEEHRLRAAARPPCQTGAEDRRRGQRREGKLGLCTDHQRIQHE